MNKVYLNIDINSVNCPYLDKVVEMSSNITAETIYPFVDIYKGTHVTDILFNIFSQVSIMPSQHFDSMVDFCEYANNNGKENEIIQNYQCYYTLTKKYNIDPFKIWIERCKENGQNPWISIRMNDCHTSLAFSTFFKYALKNDMTLGGEYGYYQNCYNYRFAEVREKMLSYIREQLERYDVYGIELDFMRECQCFKYLTENMNECTGIINGFMRGVKRIVTELEAIRGHRIKICVRVMRDITHSRFYGFDPLCWEKDGTVDVISPTARWTGGDSGIPVAQWKKLLPKTEIAAGIETAAMSYAPDRGMSYASAEIARGLAASMLSQGADSLYYFNYMINPEEDVTKDRTHVLQAHGKMRNLFTLSSCRDFESIYKYPVRFAVLPQTDEAFASYPPMWQPIPAVLKPNGEKCFEIITGKIPENKRAYIVIGSDNDISSACVMINGKECSCFTGVNLSFLPGIGTQPSNYVSEGIITKLCKVDNLTDFAQKINIKANGESIEIVWVEIVVL